MFISSENYFWERELSIATFHYLGELLSLLKNSPVFIHQDLSYLIFTAKFVLIEKYFAESFYHQLL